MILQKKPIKIWDVNVDNIVTSKLVKTKTYSKYHIGYLDKAIRPLVLIIPKMSAYAKTFRVKQGDMNLLQPFILILNLSAKTNITSKYI